MQSSPDRKHLEIHAIQSWQTTLVCELIHYTSTSPCSSYKLILTNLQAMEEKCTPPLSASSPISILKIVITHLGSSPSSITSSMLRTFTYNSLEHGNILNLLTPKYPQMQIFKLRNPACCPFLSPSQLFLCLGGIWQHLVTVQAQPKEPRGPHGYLLGQVHLKVPRPFTGI